MSRSPKMSCSVISATSAVSKPESSPSTASAICGFGSACAGGHDATGCEIVQAVLGEHMRHALARAVAPQRDHRALAVGLQRVDVLGDGFEHIGAGNGALGGKIMAGMGAGLDGVGRAVRRGERRQPGERRSVEARVPFRLGEIKPIRRQRLIRCAAVGLSSASWRA